MELLIDPSFDGSLPLSEEESRHCISVMRHRVGDAVTVSDGAGKVYHCRVVVADSRKCVLDVDSVTDVAPPAHHLAMAVAPTKNADRFEWFVEKATELGVSEIIPIICDHSERVKIRVDRLERLVTAAAKQSLKYYLPKVSEPVSAKQIIADAARFDKAFILHCNEGAKPHLFDAVPTGCSTLVLIGPEGDFSKAEIELALKQGFAEATLGEERLRTETAAMAACHIVNLKNCVSKP